MDELLKMFGGAENIWVAIQNNATKVGVESTKTMLELFYVLKSPDTSMLNKSLIVAALGYQLLPEDAVPRDRFGLLGLLDNGVTLAFAYNRVKSLVTPEIEQQVNNILRSWFDVEDKPSQQDGMSSNDDQEVDYISQPIYMNPQQQTNNHPKPSQPIWDDDEDVVID